MSLIAAHQVAKTNFAAINDVLVLDVATLGTVRFEFSGTYSFTATFEATVDGTNWFPFQVVAVNSATVTTTHSTANATQAYEASAHSVAQVRVKLTAFTSAGTHKVLVSGTQAAIEPAPVVSLAAGSAAIGTVVAQQSATAANGATTTSVNSAASTNAANVKTTAGTVYAVTVNNTTAAAKYVRLYNKASAPTVGTDTPVVVITVPATSTATHSFGGVGLRFATGIGHAITNGAAVLDATAVAAGDVQLTYEWV